jgi:hypothetical protein
MSVLAGPEVKKYSVEKFRLEARVQLRKWKLEAPKSESARMSSTELIGDHVLDGLPVSQSWICMRETQNRFAPIATLPGLMPGQLYDTVMYSQCVSLN